MNCAWCSPSGNGTDGICDPCMLLYFKVDPVTIHAEIATETKRKVRTDSEAVASKTSTSSTGMRIRGKPYC